MEYEQYKDIYLETVSVILITVKYVPDICIWHAYRVKYDRMNINGSRTSFVKASLCSSIHWNICSRCNSFQAHSLEQSYCPTQPFKHEKYKNIKKFKCKNNIKLIYLTFIHCTDKNITELNL